MSEYKPNEIFSFSNSIVNSPLASESIPMKNKKETFFPVSLFLSYEESKCVF